MTFDFCAVCWNGLCGACQQMVVRDAAQARSDSAALAAAHELAVEDAERMEMIRLERQSADETARAFMRKNRELDTQLERLREELVTARTHERPSDGPFYTLREAIRAHAQAERALGELWEAASAAIAVSALLNPDQAGDPVYARLRAVLAATTRGKRNAKTE